MSKVLQIGTPTNIRENHNDTAKHPSLKIKPEVLRKQRLIFNRLNFGDLTFFIDITFKRTNVFFTFFCKASKYPTKVFNFYKQSVGILNRQNLKGASLRGRFKKQFENIKKRFSLFKSYIYDFMKQHPEMAAYKKIFIHWKIYAVNSNLQNLLNLPFELTYNRKIVEFVVKEKLKDEILSRLNLRPRQNLSAHEIIFKEFVLKRDPNYKLHLEQFIFKRNKRHLLLDLKDEITKQLELLNENAIGNEDKLYRLAQYNQQIYKILENDKKANIDPVHFLLSKLSIITGLTVNELIVLKKISPEQIYAAGVVHSQYVENQNISLENKSLIESNSSKILTLAEMPPKNLRINLLKKLKTKKKVLEGLVNTEDKNQLAQYCSNYLDNLIKLDNSMIKVYQPVLIHKFSFKFPHNGCRPKKARRLKRTRK